MHETNHEEKRLVRRGLDFRDLVRVVNFSRTTEIDLEAERSSEGRWALHAARHNVLGSTFPFFILYFYADATASDVATALKKTKSRKSRHIVFAPSISDIFTGKHPEIIELLQAVDRFKSTREYLASFIENELSVFTTRIRHDQPNDYEDPYVGNTILQKYPNPIYAFFTDASARAARLGIVLAEPGQGKTYMTKYIAAKMLNDDLGMIPLRVDSSQWITLKDSQSSLSKTITNSLRHYGASIPWIEGHEDEFLTSALKAGVFRIIFDGFDEYLLQENSPIEPVEVLRSLSQLAQETVTPVVITCRTSFWKTNIGGPDVDSFVNECKPDIFEIQPFAKLAANAYFIKKLKPEQASEALRIYGDLSKYDDELIGRGFVLNLIADLAKDTISAHNLEQGNPLLIITEALCERETRRQSLLLSKHEQLAILYDFAFDIAKKSEKANTALLEFWINVSRPDMSSSEVTSTIKKLKSHPLLRYDMANDVWTFSQDQIRILFIALKLLRAKQAEISRFAATTMPDVEDWQDLGDMIVTIIVRDDLSLSEKHGRLRNLISALLIDVGRDNRNEMNDAGTVLAGIIALRSVEIFYPKGSSHFDRTVELSDLCGDPIRGLSFSGTIGSFDFSNVTFKRCCFDRVSFTNCEFGAETKFIACRFVRLAPILARDGLGRAIFSDCNLDREAEAVIHSAQIRAGLRAYSRRDLDADIRSIIEAFVNIQNASFRTVRDDVLRHGIIKSSPHRVPIITQFQKLILTKIDLGSSKHGYIISDTAKESINFFIVNNVFTGQIRAVNDLVAITLDI